MKYKLENTQIDTSIPEERQWLAGVLLQRGEQITRRFAYFYEKLQALPRQTRKTLQKRLAMTLAGAALLLALSGAPSVHAATITVNPGSQGIGIDGGCSLVEAIITANTAGTSGDCSGGTAGPDIITLGGGTYSYKYETSAGNALPRITSQITINGNGATIERSGATPNFFRVLHVRPSGNLTLNDATLSGGYSQDNGGGIYNERGIVVLNSSTISGNTAVNGGGIYNLNGTVTLNNNSVVGANEAYDYYGFATASGAGILNKATSSLTANLTINNSTISGNFSTGIGTQGSGIYNWGDNYGTATLIVNNSTINNNSANLDGAGVMNYGGNYGIANATIDGSAISNNAATSNGGGISNTSFTGGSATLTVRNSTISSNAAGSNGGGIHSDGGTTTVENSTITANTGGGIFGGGSVMNSIVAAQTAGADCSGVAATSQGYNIESGTTCGFTGTGDQQSVSNAALNLGGLGMNGGSTPTHALQNPSVAIEKIPIGTNGCDGTGADQRGARARRVQTWR
ncbi:MAG: hypothetical protein IPM76_13690 [Chloroflexi bacterium]|nr:hypothetical protein [Chloroflexota bacterium]